MTLAAVPAAAGTMYVDDVHEIMVRVGPSTTHQIIDKVRAGTALEVLEESAGWARIRLPGSQKTGWMVARYLTEKEPAAAALPRMAVEHREMSEKLLACTTQSQELARELGEQKKAAEEIGEKYESLAEESATFLQVKRDLAIARTELAEKRKSEQEAVQALNDLERSRGLSWFLAGAGAILAGFFLGWIVRPRKKRSSLL